MASISVAAQADYMPPRNVITIHASAGNVWESCEVFRVTPEDSVPIRKQPVTGLADVTVYDYEAQYGTEARYMVRGVDGTVKTDLSSNAMTLDPKTGWLIHPGNPAKSMAVPLGHITAIGDISRKSTATRHDILGASLPVYTVSGVRQSPAFVLQLRTRSTGDENMLDALLEDQYPLLLNLSGTDAKRMNLHPMYLQVEDVVDARYAQMLYDPKWSATPGSWRDWSLSCVRVGSPAISQQAVGWTYAQLMVENSTYQQVDTKFATYADLQADNTRKR